MKIKTVMEQLKDREIPCVGENEKINEVICAMIRFPHTRLVYVVDEQKKLVGTITVGSILRHIYPHHYQEKIHSRGMLRQITAENASHIMDKQNIFASPEDSVEIVLKRMASTGVKEMAVVDTSGRILTDITAIDLLKFHSEE